MEIKKKKKKSYKLQSLAKNALNHFMSFHHNVYIWQATNLIYQNIRWLISTLSSNSNKVWAELSVLNSLCPVSPAEQAENCLHEHKGRIANVAHLNAWPLF